MKKYILFILLGFGGGLAGSATFGFFSGSKTSALESGPVQTAQQVSFTPSARALPLSQDFTAASATTTESVVYIKTVSEQASSSWFDMFFGGGGTQQVLSSGSGVIFSEDGYIVTNNHVIDHATEIEVIFRKRPYKAKLIGKDPASDLAVLKVEGQKFPAIRLGSSRTLKVGEWVLAVGNPFNLESTVTAGIVSARGRDIDILKNQFPMESFIQTDAAINPGNSGGALVNLSGELVGINTAILSRTGSYAGYGFAVPVDVVKKIVNDLIQYQKVQKAFLGAEVTDLEFRENDPESDLSGVSVQYVFSGSQAEKSGLLKGDVIVGVNGNPIAAKSFFDEEINLLSPGDKVRLQINRKGKPAEVEILMTNEDGTTDIIRSRSVGSPTLGADFEQISKVEKEAYQVEGGVRVFNIRGGSMCARMGLEEDFVLTHVNRNAVNNAEQAIELLESTRGRVVLEGMSKNGSPRYLTYWY